MQTIEATRYGVLIEDIGYLSWSRLSEAECVDVAWAYYYFSIQFRENLGTAREMLPDDEKLRDLEAGECDTDNLSPWPGIAAIGERLNHDEFMRRAIALRPGDEAKRQMLAKLGEEYLAATRAMSREARAMSIASYEDGGLELVFKAILRMPEYPNPVLQAFRHFLSEHIRFDSDEGAGHGALARHLCPDDRIVPLWTSFKSLLLSSVPSLAGR